MKANMYKTTRVLAAPLFCILALTQCEHVLDTAPIGELNDRTFYQTEKDFEAASLAPYSTLLNLYFDQSGLGTFQGLLIPDDDTRPPAGGSPQEEFNWLASNGQFAYIWEQAYRGIQRSNTVLDRLPQARGFPNEASKARFEAEAKFIRAYFYFLLARNFGEVPLVTAVITNITNAQVGNSKPGEVWDLIESDLEFAAANLPEKWGSQNVGRATKWSALALLGKVELYRAQWMKQPAKYQEAIEHFNQVVSSGQFTLVPNYADNFSEARENNVESVFEIQMTRGDFNPWLPTDFGLSENQNVGAAGSGRVIFMAASCGPTNVCAPGANSFGYGSVHITPSLQAAFEEGDPRRVYTLYKEGDIYVGTTRFNPAWSVTGSTPSKYVKQSLNLTAFPPNITSNNERVIRYADVLLMLAEAELLGNGNIGRAAQLINQVRARARQTYQALNNQPAPAGLLPDRSAGVSRAQMFQWLLHERRVELALEVHRYDDLVRWHRAGLINIKQDIDFGSTIANQSWSERNLLKPIPQRELDNNLNLTQNPGY